MDHGGAGVNPDDRVYPTLADGTEGPAVDCQWFALCTRPANGLRPHPTLGPVPICIPCNDKMERLSA